MAPRGIVFAPWVPVSLRALRASRRAIRSGAILTSPSLQCQYPVRRWDLALALTHGREGINPRPVAMRRIRNRLRTYAGEHHLFRGVNDDVNKFVWADQDWDPGAGFGDAARPRAVHFTTVAKREKPCRSVPAQLSRRTGGGPWCFSFPASRPLALAV